VETGKPVSGGLGLYARELAIVPGTDLGIGPSVYTYWLLARCLVVKEPNPHRPEVAAPCRRPGVGATSVAGFPCSPATAR